MSTHRPDDELSFHFRLDHRLLARSNRFVFTVSVEGGGGGDLSKAQQLLPPAHPFGAVSATTSLVTWCLPPAGNPLQSVRSSDGGICALGFATMFGGHPDHVVGKVYSPPLASYDANPPSDARPARMVNAPGCPDFIPPSPCGTINFAFHPTFASELTGAGHSSSGVANDVVIWLLTGSAVSGPHVTQFRGVTGTTSECPPDVEAPAPPAALVAGVDLRPAPAKLSLQVTAPFLAQPIALPLTRRDAECNLSESVWASCSKAHPEMRWKLWVMHNNGHPYAILSLQHLFGTRLEAPLVWRALAWNLPGEVRFQSDSPDATAQMPVVVVTA